MPTDQQDNSTLRKPVARRKFLAGAAAGAATLALPRWATAENSFASAFTLMPDDDLAAIRAEIAKRHDEALQRLQTWIKQPSIAAENRGMSEGCELTMQMFRDAGFQQVSKVPTDGQPGIFATLDAGAPKTLGLYFMYDVKQVDPSEWTSPPWEARLVDKPGFGKVIVGRGAVNQKGPEASFIAAPLPPGNWWEARIVTCACAEVDSRTTAAAPARIVGSILISFLPLVFSGNGGQLRFSIAVQ